MSVRVQNAIIGLSSDVSENSYDQSESDCSCLLSAALIKPFHAMNEISRNYFNIQQNLWKNIFHVICCYASESFHSSKLYLSYHGYIHAKDDVELFTLFHNETEFAKLGVLCVCVSQLFWTSWLIYMKLGRNIMSLGIIIPWFFLYHEQWRGNYVNFSSGIDIRCN